MLFLSSKKVLRLRLYSCSPASVVTSSEGVSAGLDADRHMNFASAELTWLRIALLLGDFLAESHANRATKGCFD